MTAMQFALAARPPIASGAVETAAKRLIETALAGRWLGPAKSVGRHVTRITLKFKRSCQQFGTKKLTLKEKIGYRVNITKRDFAFAADNGDAALVGSRRL